MAGFSEYAAADPHKVAAIFPDSGETLTRGQLEAATNRAAHALRALGLKRGDCVALSLPNGPEFLAAMLAAQRSGLIYVLMSTKLSVGDAGYILADSGASVAVVSRASFAAQDEAGLRAIHPAIHGIGLGSAFPDWPALLATMPETRPDHCSRGVVMLYSSGTTGRPKGIRKALPDIDAAGPDPLDQNLVQGYGMGGDAVVYCACPLYHAAPHRFVSAALSAGAAVVVPGHFDAAEALAHIARYRVTHSMWVPTMFHRLLRLPEAARRGQDLSSHRHAIHGAAPCPVHVKRAMIEWWGPILDEYYSGSEGIGSTTISSAEWLQHPGSVGRPRGCKVHILGPDGEELPVGETGDIFFETEMQFEYWNDPEKTRKASNQKGWRTFGDIGRVDADGYLYLSDRKHFTIISGGVNIYPQELESVFLEHELVHDAGVIGIPDEEFGQSVLAVVQPVEGAGDPEALKKQLLEFARQRLGPVKAPRRIELVDSLPRHDTGKLYKTELIGRFGG